MQKLLLVCALIALAQGQYIWDGFNLDTDYYDF